MHSINEELFHHIRAASGAYRDCVVVENRWLVQAYSEFYSLKITEIDESFYRDLTNLTDQRYEYWFCSEDLEEDAPYSVQTAPLTLYWDGCVEYPTRPATRFALPEAL